MRSSTESPWRLAIGSRWSKKLDMAERPIHLDLPATADRPAIPPVRSGRTFGVRIWLALIFAAIGILTGTSVYLFVSESSNRAARGSTEDISRLQTNVLSNQVLQTLRGFERNPDPSRPAVRAAIEETLAESRTESFRTWFVDADRELITQAGVNGNTFSDVPGRDEALDLVFDGEEGAVVRLPNQQFAIAFPVIQDGVLAGAVLTLADRPLQVAAALETLQRERLTALSIAVLVAAIIGFLVASLIATRVKRLAAAAGELAEGHLNVRVNPSGRDEIGDLGRALDSMRIALAETFASLSSERDRLSAIFSSLDQAVMVVDAVGDVRFANPAAAELVDGSGRPIEGLRPWIRRATHRGSAGSDHEQIGDRTYAISARNLPAENAALVVVRDRTEELRKDEAEREFVSNAAHELRNPIAGMSGAIEVLRSGAKEDPEARDRFIERLAIDIERTSRLTRSLLTLARMEAIGEGEGEVVSASAAIEEAIATVEPPKGIDVQVDVSDDPVALADPVLLRQILVGLLSNAYKHTPAPGTVYVRACRKEGEGGEGEVVIEVEDTGEGISEAERGRVFERFYRGSGSLEREGFGLGLAIAKRMVDVMGGEIKVESEEGVGSKFIVRLPISEQAPTLIA